MRSCDVLVIGGGIAGVSAALAAQSRGASTILIRRGPGATALVAGGWHGTPPPPILQALAGAGHPLESCGADVRLPHADGRLLQCDVAPAAHVAAAFDGGAELGLVCEIAGLPAFRATALCRLWSEGAGLVDRSLEPLILHLPSTPAGGWSAVSLAGALERDPQLLATPLAHAVRERGAARVILPPVLGLDDHVEVITAVRARAGVTIGEALGGNPSVPGWRLDRALMRSLAAGGVTVLTGTARREGQSGNQFTVDAAGAVECIQAGAVVLAAGRYIGGGVQADPQIREAALSLDVRPAAFGRWFDDATQSLALTLPQRDGQHALLEVGVDVDADGRVLAARGGGGVPEGAAGSGRPAGDAGSRLPAGATVPPAVFAAGSIRAGTETAALGLGLASDQGWTAGLHAADAAPTRTG